MAEGREGRGLEEGSRYIIKVYSLDHNKHGIYGDDTNANCCHDWILYPNLFLHIFPVITYTHRVRAMYQICHLPPTSSI